MITIIRLGFLAPIFLFLSLLPKIASATTICDTSCMQLMQTKLDTYREQNRIPGMSMTISIGNNRLLNFYSGNEENLAFNPNAPKVNANSLFEIGSITKSFIAAIILQLDAERKLSVNDEVNHWLPEIKDPRWGNATIKQLLNMTSGIPDYISQYKAFQVEVIKNPGKLWATEDLVNVVYPKIDFAAGTSWHYSNTGYLLAGMIIEKATGKSLAANLGSRVFKQLHLSTAFIKYDPAIVPFHLDNMVHGYTEGEKYFDGDAAKINTSIYNAAGGIITTSQIIAIWIKSLFSGKVLPVSQFAKMTELVCVDSGWVFHGCKPGQLLPSDSKFVGYSLGLGWHPAQNNMGPVWNYLGSTAGYFSAWYYVDAPRFGQLQAHDFLITFCADIDPTASTEKSLKNLMQEIYSYFYSK